MLRLFSRTALVGALLTVAAVAQQFYTTPYDLVRPVWPQTWDTTVFDLYTPGRRARNMPTNKTPADFRPNEIIPDTLGQAYLDAMNLKMSPIRVNQAGYLPDDEKKLIYYVGKASDFEVVDLTGKVLGKGTWNEAGAKSPISSSYTIVSNYSAEKSFPDNVIYSAKGVGPSGTLLKGVLPPGLPIEQRMRIKVGSDYSSTFVISENVYSMLRDAGLKFFGVNRSGKGESWFHPASHTKDGMGPVVSGKEKVSAITSTEGSLEGGWYDCGDHLKESQTQAYAFMVLAVMSGANPTRDLDHYAYNQSDAVNIDGVPDMLREAKHGADFFLRAYDVANGVIDNMPVSVGNFGSDHGWWGRPEFQDIVTISGRGGPNERDVRLGELGSNISGQIAAGLAILAVEYARFDPDFAAKCLKVSEEMYDFAKNLAQGKSTYGNGKPFVYNTKAAGWSSSAYNGNNEFFDDMALASVALLYATKDAKYLSDALQDKNLGVTPAQQFMDGAGPGAFPGGWFVTNDKGFLKNGKNTSWANCYSYALYALYKLILETPEKASLYKISESTRKDLLQDVAYSMIYNLGDMNYETEGFGSIVLPSQGVINWKSNIIKYDPIWFTMKTDQSWIYNRYQAGNIVEVLMYAEMAAAAESMNLGGISDWKSKDMRQLGINQLNYMLGLNPWDVSMVIGVGDKNDAHPHHRSANPEGKNVPGGYYKYRPPTGVIYGGITPAQGANDLLPATASWEDYHLSEACVDAAATLFGSTTLASKSENIDRAPKVSVEIKYVGFDSAIVVVKQDVFGSAKISLGTSESKLDQTFSSTANGVVHTFNIKPLANGTTYFFTATSINARSDSSTTKYLVDSTKTPYTFTTLNSPPAAADIQNVKVCNVSADSAEIMWYTPNGEYNSSIYYDTVLTSYDKMANPRIDVDVAGVPTKFHYVKIGGLKERTTYYYVVESNGVRKAVDDNGQPLKFTTPVRQYKFEVRTYEYALDGLQFVNFNIFNKEDKPFDSLQLRLYVNANEEQMSNCNTMFDIDICNAYYEDGNSGNCESNETLRARARGTSPVKLEDTYNPTTKQYGWYVPLNLGSTTIKSSSRLRVDMRFSKGIGNLVNGKIRCDPLVQHAVKTFGASSGDWSWMPHFIADGDPIDYVGMPTEDKEFGDGDQAPINPYVAVYRKDQFVWGNSPSYSEMTTKRADYELKMGLEAPFNVPDGSYIRLDSSISTLYVKGQAEITEAGVVNAIWVNGKKVADLASAAVYNATTGKFDLNIPVKLGIGANKVDITVFAGPSMDCEACQENGGCAFVNRSFYVEFSKGNLTASSLRIANADGTPVSSPVENPSATAFHIYVTDKDKAKTGSVYAYVINARKLDTLKVKLSETSSNNGEFQTSSLIQGVGKDAASTSGNEISFYGGDTLYVRYIDAEDEEDISEQTIFAKPTYPVPQYALALDGNCDGKTDSLRVVFTSDFNEGDSFDTLWVSLRNPVTLEGDSFKVVVNVPVVGKSVVTVALPPRAGLPATSAPVGYISAYMKSKASTVTQIEKATIRDGIAPVLVGVAILENPPFGKGAREAQDTLKISFSEPVSLASKSAWPLAVVDSLGKAVDATGIKVIGNATTADNGLSWLYVVEGNTDGAVLHDGYTATVQAGFGVSDMGLNELDQATCNEPVRITETPRPVPITAAYIKDRQGDGIADFIYMKFERKLRQKDMLDSFVVEWGDPVVYRHFMPSSWKEEMEYGSHTETQVSGEDTVDVTVADTFSVLTIEIPESQRFPYGTTHGKANGYGSVLPRLGPLGGFFDKTYPVADLCPPVIMSARLSSKTVDSLGVKMSEPLDTIETGFYLERRRENVIFQHTAVAGRKSGQEWVFFFNGDDPTAVRLGDYIRLVPNDKAKYLDKADNVPTDSNKWVEIKGAATDKLGFSVIAVKSVSGGTDNSGYGDFQPEDNEVFRLTWVDPDNGSETLLATGGARLQTAAVATNYDSSSYHHVGPTFQIDVVLPTATLTASGNPVWEFVLNLDAGLFDNLGQAVMATTYHFDLGAIGGMDKLADDGSMRLRLEWMVPKGQTSPATASGRAVGTGAYIGNFDFKAVSTYVSDVAADEDPSTGIYKRGDVEKAKDSERVIFGVRR